MTQEEMLARAQEISREMKILQDQTTILAAERSWILRELHRRKVPYREIATALDLSIGRIGQLMTGKKK